uniref:Piwi domain-containing protein n=1 Tax=Caenorhabditis tropicalis TaxID=1561998 RepID=A0A1I7SXD6_9PELO
MRNGKMQRRDSGNLVYVVDTPFHLASLPQQKPYPPLLFDGACIFIKSLQMRRGKKMNNFDCLLVALYTLYHARPHGMHVRPPAGTKSTREEKTRERKRI